MGCKSKKTSLLVFPSSCPSPSKQKIRRVTQNSDSPRRVHLWERLHFFWSYESPPFISPLFFFFATAPSLRTSIINCFFLYSSLLFWLKTISSLVLLIFLHAVSIMAWATNTALRSLFCKAFCSFLMLSFKTWFI